MTRHIYSTTMSVEVDVDVTDEDLSNEDLLEICRDRGLVFGSELMQGLAEHYKLKQHDLILEKVRKAVQDALGVVL